MARSVFIVGAGIGGLTAATYLARRGYQVGVLEARSEAGGLAHGQALEGLRFDAGPYILLDRPGLEFAFRELALDLEACLALRRVKEVYEVSSADGRPPVRVYDSLDRTADALDRQWPGSGRKYREFVEATSAAYRRLQPLQRVSRPSLIHVMRTGGWRNAPLLLRSLETALSRTGLPKPAQDALGIWTHVAGQRSRQAPSPLALVPAMIHTFGAWLPEGGIGAVAEALTEAARRAGAEFRFGTTVRAIRCSQGRAAGVETAQGEFLPADAVLSNASGLGTYLQLLRGPADEEVLPQRARRRLAALPLQSPGVCAYLAVNRPLEPPCLRFHLPGGDRLCRLLVQPGVVDPTQAGGDWRAARLIAPMRHEQAMALGEAGQAEFLQSVLDERWWRDHVGEARVLATRTPAQWAREFHLHRESMNPVMTARFMRRGRLAHRSPHVRGLYLAGSATHPGQWVSFCAISGILAAEQVCEDLS